MDFNDFIFRECEKDEIEKVLSIISERVLWMDKVGIHQWNETDYLNVYPKSYFEEMQKNHALFVLENKENGEIAACGVLKVQDERWDSIKNNENLSSLYLHNFAVMLKYKGAGSIFMENAELYTKAKGYKFFRLDSAVGNKKLEDYYEKRGYVSVGNCADGEYFGILREKKL